MVKTRSQTYVDRVNYYSTSDCLFASKYSGATAPDPKPVKENPSPPPTRATKRPRTSLKTKGEHLGKKSTAYGLMDMPVETFAEASTLRHASVNYRKFHILDIIQCVPRRSNFTLAHMQDFSNNTYETVC
jgi:hypothetical protein